jgi:CheY-like chemotaxis protein
MPIMDGKEAASIIREICPRMPIMAITANLVESESDDMSGFDEIAYKPLKREFLFKLIRKHLEKERERDFV